MCEGVCVCAYVYILVCMYMNIYVHSLVELVDPKSCTIPGEADGVRDETVH